jgi:DNA-directed RNA polymerase alpha subunit
MKKRKFTSAELSILRKNRFSKLDLTVRALQVFEKNNIRTLGTLLQYSEEEVLKLEGYWRARIHRIEDIKNELNKIGLHLRKV